MNRKTERKCGEKTIILEKKRGCEGTDEEIEKTRPNGEVTFFVLKKSRYLVWHAKRLFIAQKYAIPSKAVGNRGLKRNLQIINGLLGFDR